MAGQIELLISAASGTVALFADPGLETGHMTMQMVDLPSSTGSATHVVGVAGRYPGSKDGGVEGFWQTVSEGQDLPSQVIIH